MCYVYYLVYFYKKVSQRKEDVIKVIRRRKYIYSTIHIYFLNLHVSGPVQGSTVQASVRPRGQRVRLITFVSSHRLGALGLYELLILTTRYSCFLKEEEVTKGRGRESQEYVQREGYERAILIHSQYRTQAYKTRLLAFPE